MSCVCVCACTVYPLHCQYTCSCTHSLDPETDPLCVLLMVDYYSVRACDYQFLVDLDKRWGVSRINDFQCILYTFLFSSFAVYFLCLFQAKRNLSQLPNCAFSIPLALFHHSLSLSEEEKQTLTLTEADQKLQSALFMFPSVRIGFNSKSIGVLQCST